MGGKLPLSTLCRSVRSRDGDACGPWSQQRDSGLLSLVILLASPSFEGANVRFDLIGHLPEDGFSVWIIDHRRKTTTLRHSVPSLLN